MWARAVCIFPNGEGRKADFRPLRSAKESGTLIEPTESFWDWVESNRHLLAERLRTGRVAMELHQIRYFIALSKTLNFTRAAEECNVSQPALSRAISQLEAELGSELFRRERSLTHMTEFGQTVLVELRRCYEASQNARSIAREYLKGGHAPLNIALARTIEMDFLSPMLGEMLRAFPKTEIKITRGPPHEISEKLKGGEVEIAISGPLGDGWERLEVRKLYEQEFGLLLNSDHRLSQRNAVELADLTDERLLSRSYCSLCETILQKLKELGARNISRHEVPGIDDLPGLVQSRFGVGIWPVSRRVDNGLIISKVHGIEMSRWIHLHTVFGRRLSPGAAALVGLMRANDWQAALPKGTTNSESVH